MMETMQRLMIAMGCAMVLGTSPRLADAQYSFTLDASHKKEWLIGNPLPSPCPVRMSMLISTANSLTPCYQSIRFRVQPATGRTFASDGKVTVQLHVSNYGDHRQTMNFHIPVRAGETVAEEGMVAYTALQGANSFQIEGAWNGMSYGRLSSNAYTTFYGQMPNSFFLELLSEDSINPLSGDMKSAFSAIENADFPVVLAGDVTKANIYGVNSGVHCLADVAKMPADWRQFAHFHHVSATPGTLKKLDEAGRRVLSQYVWCGGTLEVLGLSNPSDLKPIIQADWDRTIEVPNFQAQVYRAGLGSVVFNRRGGNETWDELNHASRLSRLSKRLGDDYWNWLIPEVGKTPIWVFLGAVALLVGIGAPAVLFWSQRMQRRIWTILAIPVLSLTSVLALFAYGTIKDGWGALVRIRSITTLDPDGNGAVWSRQTYFAASIPDGKIRLEPQVEMIPLYSNKMSPIAQFQDGTHQEQIYSGVLSLRQQRQVSITHGVNDVQILRTGSGLSESGMPITKNISERTIAAVVCSDASGRLFRAENIPPGGIIAWQETEARDAAKWLRSFYDAQRLELPPDAPDQNARSIFDAIWRSPTWVTGNSISIGRTFEEEDCWTEAISTWGADTPRKFVAVVDQAPQLQKCLENAKETSSLHMVVGHWRPGE